MSQGLLDAIAGALLKAGANVEIIAAAVGAYAEWESAKRPRGRQRKSPLPWPGVPDRTSSRSIAPGEGRAVNTGVVGKSDNYRRPDEAPPPSQALCGVTTTG